MFTTLGATLLTMGAKLVPALTSRFKGVSWTLSLGGGLVLGAAGAAVWTTVGNWSARQIRSGLRTAGKILFMFNQFKVVLDSTRVTLAHSAFFRHVLRCH